MGATERLHFHALEKEMATHSSILAWEIPGTEEPSGLLSMGSLSVGHDWSDLAAAAAAAIDVCALWLNSNLKFLAENRTYEKNPNKNNFF